MIKEVNNIVLNASYEVIIEHPIMGFGEFIMFVSKWQDSDTYIFTIPVYSWIYRKKPNEEINFKYAPSGFNHPHYKTQLIAAMNKIIELINKNNF